MVRGGQGDGGEEGVGDAHPSGIRLICWAEGGGGPRPRHAMPGASLQAIDRQRGEGTSMFGRPRPERRARPCEAGVCYVNTICAS